MSKLFERDRGATLSAGEMPLEARSLTGAISRAPHAAARDSELVASCRAGDPRAFAQLVGLHEGMVVNLAARLLGEAEEARDVAQEVFLQVYRRLGAFQGRSSLKTWIYRIAVNQCHNRRRFWHRRRRDRETPLDEGLLPTQRPLGGLAGPGHSARTSPGYASGTSPGYSSGTSPYEETLRRERARRVQAALLGLRFDQRAVLVLREMEGLTCEEVAATLGVPEGTVKSRLSRAREAMRRRLRGLVEEGSTS